MSAKRMEDIKAELARQGLDLIPCEPNKPTCDTCKHWTPTLGRNRTDRLSTWGTCAKLLAVNCGVIAEPLLSFRAEPDVNPKDLKPLTPKSFGCIKHEEIQ